MDYDTITYAVADNTALLTLNRPDKMNSLNTQMRAEILDAAKRAESEARVLVITGEGRAFCTGQDLGDTTTGAADLERTLRDEYEPMLRAIINADIPVIAAVNGPAAGAGASLALAADVVIASQSAYFLQAFARIGLMPDAGGTYVLPRVMGQARAMGAALFADKITAQQAADWGMIWEAVADDSFDETWKARAAYFANGPTRGFAAIKKSIRQSWNNSLDAQLTLEAKMQSDCGQTRDFQEGVIAFMEKRAPNFEGS